MQETPPPEPAPVVSAATPPGWERDTLEKLAFFALREQRAARRWKIFFRFFWFSLVLVLLWAFYSDVAPTTTVSTPHTAVIEVRGEIAWDTEASAQAVNGALRLAFEDPGAQAVVLLVNSPGGSPVQAGMIHDEILRLRQLHNKPVYAVIEEVGASAAYYVAVAADRIFVDKASLVGSIGVLIDGFGFTELMGKVGVERRLLTAGENKGFLDPFSPLNPAQQAHAQDMLNDIHQQFIEVVRQGRGDRLKAEAEAFSGLVWSGERAVAIGLADAMGSLEYVAREVVKAPDIVDYTHRENVAERLARRFGAGVGESVLQVLRSEHFVLR